MDPFSLAAGVLSTSGQIQANRANRRMAIQQMQFQEHMSSTAAQRAVKDFTAAGLNPALAYGTTASTPGGASATMGSETETGISNARETAAVRQAMKIAAAQSEADLIVKRETAARERASNTALTQQANLTRMQELEAQRMFQFNIQAQPHDLRTRAAQALLAEAESTHRRLGLTEAQNTARFYQQLGAGSGALFGSARNLAEILKLFRR